MGPESEKYTKIQRPMRTNLWATPCIEIGIGLDIDAHKRLNRRQKERRNTIGQNVTYILVNLIQMETRFNELSEPKLKSVFGRIIS